MDAYLTPLVAPVNLTPFGPNEDPDFPQGGVRVLCTPIPYKTLKYFKQAISTCGTNSPYVVGLFRGLAEQERMIPHDWDLLAHTCLDSSDFFTI